jgi:hypothetical protein
MQVDVRIGSWLCENAKTRDGDRRSYSSKTALTVKRASELNLPNDPKNVILAAFQSFAFLHSQGHQRTLAPFNRDFRSCPVNGHRQSVGPLPKSARNGHNESRAESSTKSGVHCGTWMRMAIDHPPYPKGGGQAEVAARVTAASKLAQEDLRE